LKKWRLLPEGTRTAPDLFKTEPFFFCKNQGFSFKGFELPAFDKIVNQPSFVAPELDNLSMVQVSEGVFIP
jgi:hypothetical protein